MPTAMHLTLLVSLFAVAVCASTTNSPATEKVISTTTVNPTSLTVKQENDLLSKKTTDSTPQRPTTTPQITNTVTSEKASPSSPLLTSSQTLKTTEETRPSSPHPSATTNQTSNETITHESTLPSAPPNTTAATTMNTTSPVLLPHWDKGGLAENPGLVAILCIFCIVLVLVLVVAAVKCIQSPRSNFERLEDVPMGKVNEGSPFAQYSK